MKVVRTVIVVSALMVAGCCLELPVWLHDSIGQCMPVETEEGCAAPSVAGLPGAEGHCCPADCVTWNCVCGEDGMATDCWRSCACGPTSEDDASPADPCDSAGQEGGLAGAVD